MNFPIRTQVFTVNYGYQTFIVLNRFEVYSYFRMNLNSFSGISLRLIVIAPLMF